jgi:hypothetical protein
MDIYFINLYKEPAMTIPTINWLAVGTCILVSMVIGSLWFNQKTFFPIWWKAIGKAENAEPGMQISMALVWGLTLLASFLQAVCMAIMVNAIGSIIPGGSTLVSGAIIGFALWFGFVAPASLTNKLFAGQWKAWLLETGNHLLVFVAFGAILGAWR